jgi:hypothetical protein
MLFEAEATGRRRALLRLVEETLRAITPHVISAEAVEDLPEADPQSSVDFLNEWVEMGIPEFRSVATLMFFCLNLYALLRKGHLYPRLNDEAQAAVMESLFSVGGLVGYVFFYLLATPVVSAYYSRADVQKVLGFDIEALKEESEKRLVSRNGDLPPKEAAPGASPTEGAG